MSRLDLLFRLYDRLEGPFLDWSARHILRLLRFGLGVVFLWFGVLKFVPGLDPVEPLVRTLLPLEPFSVFFTGLGIFEIVIEAGLMSRKLPQVAASLSIVTLFVRADAMFSLFPLVLTLGGQHVLKNLIFLGAAMVLLTADSDR